jgi:hypothetical protein
MRLMWSGLRGIRGKVVMGEFQSLQHGDHILREGTDTSEHSATYIGWIMEQAERRRKGGSRDRRGHLHCHHEGTSEQSSKCLLN